MLILLFFCLIQMTVCAQHYVHRQPVRPFWRMTRACEDRLLDHWHQRAVDARMAYRNSPHGSVAEMVRLKNGISQALQTPAYTRHNPRFTHAMLELQGHAAAWLACYRHAMLTREPFNDRNYDWQSHAYVRYRWVWRLVAIRESG